MEVDDELSWIKQRLNFTARFGEFNVVDGMWNVRVTSHVLIKDVAGLLTEERVLHARMLSDETLKGAGFDWPRIAVAALNPHADDGGAIGREEIDIIAPEIEKAKAKQIDFAGPFPSDTLYLKVRDGEYDSAVSMFHDQGQVAIKLLGFHKGVNGSRGPANANCNAGSRKCFWYCVHKLRQRCSPTKCLHNVGWYDWKP